MNDIINIIPAKYHAVVLFALAFLPYVTRAWHALTSGGGLKGIWNAIFFGTNTPKPEAVLENPAQGKLPIALMAIIFLPALFVGCAMFHSVQIKTDPDGSKTESRQTITTLFDAKSEVSKLRASTTDKTQGLTLGSLSDESSGSNVVSLTESVVGAAVSAAIKSAVPVPK